MMHVALTSQPPSAQCAPAVVSAAYASWSPLLGLPQSTKGDLESLCYTVLEMWLGYVP
jgi:hypothetical protein